MGAELRRDLGRLDGRNHAELAAGLRNAGLRKYSRGYKTGGFNSGYIAPNPETSPEYVDAVEIGAKKLFGSMFQINGAAFYYNYQNDQQPLTVQNAATTRSAA